MDAVSFVTWLYVIVPIVSTAAYIPQIVRVAKRPHLGVGLSVPTWAMWTTTSALTLLYAVIVVQNNLLAVTGLVNLTGSAIILGYAVAARMLTHKDTGDGKQ